MTKRGGTKPALIEKKRVDLTDWELDSSREVSDKFERLVEEIGDRLTDVSAEIADVFRQSVHKAAGEVLDMVLADDPSKYGACGVMVTAPVLIDEDDANDGLDPLLVELDIWFEEDNPHVYRFSLRDVVREQMEIDGDVRHLNRGLPRLRDALRALADEIDAVVRTE